MTLLFVPFLRNQTQLVRNLVHTYTYEMVTLSFKGLFTVRVSISVCSDANKWVQLISLVLFTFNDSKHQKEKDANAKADAHCELTLKHAYNCLNAFLDKLTLTYLEPDSYIKRSSYAV